MNAADRRKLGRVARAHAAGVKIAERRFNRAIGAIMRGAHKALIDHVTLAGKALFEDAKIKTPAKVKGLTSRAPLNVDKALNQAIQHIEPQLAPLVEAAHVQLLGALSKNYSATMTEVMPIGWTDLASNIQAVAVEHRDWSVSLVEDAFRSYSADVRDVFGDPSKTFGDRWEGLRDALLERGGVSESRAELIARDQTLKLNGAIAKTYQEESGLTHYVWSTSLDERVRKEHKALEGKVIAWHTPPEVGHPGQDYQCRCVALPYMDD